MSRRARLRDVELDALVMAVHPEGPPTALSEILGQVDHLRLVELAARHRVASLLLDRTHTLGIALAPDAQARLKAVASAAAAGRLHVASILPVITSSLDVPTLVVKGPVLANNWWPDPATRDYNDLDVLVRREDLSPAVEQLLDAGARLKLRNWSGWIEHVVGELPLLLGPTVIDLHWSLIATASDRDGFQWRESDLFDRSVASRVGSIEVETLAPVDTLLHLCINTGLAGGRRLGRLLDIDAVVRTGRIEFDEFVERAQETAAGAMCGVLLQRCERLLATPMPADTLRALTSRARLTVSDALDRYAPRDDDSVAPGLFIASSRRSRRRTARALASGVRTAAAIRRGRPGPADPGGALDWFGGSESTMSADRERYFALVAGQVSRRNPPSGAR